MSLRLYIGKLSQSTGERELEDAFKTFGRITKLDVKNGFAFLEYADNRDAEDAMHDMNGKEIDGSRIIVEAAKGARDNRSRVPKTDFRVTVEGLNQSTSWQDLKDFAREAGRPIFTDVFNRQGERVGVIEYETYGDMENALRKLDDADLKGNRVRVVEERRGGGGGRGRSRDRSYDRGDRGYHNGGGGRYRDDYRDSYRDRRSRSRDRGGYRDRRSRDRYDDYRR
mmetsp:Transcript_7080/g.10575  ORF Transcript_7080/g.10575 Transcript_7080/m.10575 type:complete len:225 (+) Transcript_7080:71-745(+)|eukprot:CAMPEP_0185022920 /NCGR_PEP_ID=MMETSP1103-20130426/5634_1 /TAXON_ID=36769 /ORGANISM="Paraphysomonas bandaiensis, Strain Caron Lab Isolate" /LENGTH=224 /DNA_ID=CAMNT_0027555245 /DNA_START=73 /DNA_END=747 /DNA_ORIENTATION=+